MTNERVRWKIGGIIAGKNLSKILGRNGFDHFRICFFDGKVRLSHSKINYRQFGLPNVHDMRFLGSRSQPHRMGAPTFSEIIVIWDLHVLGSIELLLHLSDLRLINLNLSWSENWCFNQRQLWLAKKKMNKYILELTL